MNKYQSKAVVAVIFIITFLALLSIKNLKFDVSPDALLQSTDNDFEFYTKFREKFQSDTDYDVIIVGLKNSRGIFQKEFLEKTDSLTKFITKLEHIQKVYSLTTSNLIYFNDGQFNARPLIHVSQPEFYLQDSIYLFQSPEYRDLLISKDGHSIAIVAFNAQHLQDSEKENLLLAINYEIHKIGFDETHLAAKIRVEHILEKEIKASSMRYLFVISLLICFLLLLFHRVSKAMVLSIFISIISIIWLLAFIAVLSVKLNMLTVMLPILLMVFSLPAINYIASNYLTVLNTRMSPFHALKTTFNDLGQITYFSILSKSMIFIPLIFSTYPALREFGLLTFIAILIPFLITIVLVPTYCEAWPMSTDNLKSESKYSWHNQLIGVLEFVNKNKYPVVLACVVLTIFSGYFGSRLEINENNQNKIPRGSALQDDYTFLEKDFYGTRSFELSLIANDSSKSFFDNSLLKQVETIEGFLKDSCHMAYIISPISLIKGANKAYHGGNIADFILPSTQAETSTYAENIMQTQYADELQRHIVQDGSELRISGKLPDLSIKEFDKLCTHFDRYFKSKSYSESFNYRMTGPSFLMDKFVVHLTKSLLLGLILALFLTACFNFYLYRSWSVTFITMIPILFIIVVTSGIMGFFHIDINTGTVLFFIILFSVMIDYSLYFMHRIQIEILKEMHL